ncbi:uncharacterized protein [Medicago truncatula]|uniref:uncharacterized protein n=1 Tax=Medicago truncatula TaxID=3880 RepID=UPI000D2F2972|nr:uncharacterized protein LOC112422055 [Medicago truncatula]
MDSHTNIQGRSPSYRREGTRPGIQGLNFWKLSYAQSGSLIRPFSLDEVKQAVWDCESFKSPGPDGINLGFIKDFWNELKDDFMKFLLDFHRNGKLTKGVNSTFIALIPKVASPQKLGDFRPISLVGCMYKVLAKVLANRLRSTLSYVVSDNQSAFVRGKQILDGILIANEVVDEAKRLKKDLLLFKVDFEKAYDSIDLNYLNSVMLNMNFPTLWRKWIMECVGTATTSVLVNGCRTDEFPIQRGLRQGDPLSPFLFLLAAEGFDILMKASVSSNLFNAYGIGPQSEIKISHLQFADDTIIIGEKCWLNVHTIRAVLLLLEEVSGLKVKFNKSMLTGVNISHNWLTEAASVLNCKTGTIPFMYLGLPIGGDSRRLSFWKPVVDRIVARLSSWNNKFLSLGGRLVLLKSVLSSLPVYFLSFFKAPAGGLGVRRLGEFNLSLLGKWCWRLLIDKEGLWYRVLKARYGKVGGRIQEGGREASGWWSMLCKVRDGVGSGVGNWFDVNVRREVGNGSSTFFWTDKWLGGVPLKIQFSRLYDLSVHKECSVADIERWRWVEGGNGWVWRQRLLAWEEESMRECITLLDNIVLQVHIQDRWRWLLDPVHGYSVGGTYRFLTNSEEQVANDVFIDVWHKLVPTKVSLFAWRLLQDRIPTRENLVRRLILQPNDNLCVGGCGLSETTGHLFIGCESFGSVWVLLGHWLGFSFVPPGSIKDHYIQFTHLAGLPRSTYVFLKVIWLACVWAIWKERNNRVFNDTVIDPLHIVEKVKLNSFLWLSSNIEPIAFGFYDWWRHPLFCMGVI